MVEWKYGIINTLNKLRLSEGVARLSYLNCCELLKIWKIWILKSKKKSCSMHSSASVLFWQDIPVEPLYFRLARRIFYSICLYYGFYCCWTAAKRRNDKNSNRAVAPSSSSSSSCHQKARAHQKRAQNFDQIKQ